MKFLRFSSVETPKTFEQNWQNYSMHWLILNVALDERGWLQDTFASQFAKFLSTVHSTENLTRKILSPSLVDQFEVPCFSGAEDAWKLGCPNTDWPKKPFSQRQWDEPLCKSVRNNLINTSTNTADHDRLFAVGEWKSSLWLQVLPVT